MSNESTTGFDKQTETEHSIASHDSFVRGAGFDGAPSEASDPVWTSGDAVTPLLAGPPGPSMVTGTSAAKPETATRDADHAVTPHPGSVMTTGTSLGNVEMGRETGRSGAHGNEDQTFAFQDQAEWDMLLSREALRKTYISWLEQLEHVSNTDTLRIEEVTKVRPAFPEGIDEQHRNLVEARMTSALAKSRDYSLRFAGLVRARCAALGLPIRKGEAGEFTVDHFVTVSLSISTLRRLVTVNGKRLDDPITVERAVELIRTQHRAIRPAGFDAREFLSLLFGAYRHVASTGHNPASTLTLADCLLALRTIFIDPHPEPHPEPQLPRQRGRPPSASGKKPLPSRKSREYSETRFRSDMSRLLASDIDRTVEGHRLHLQQVRGNGALLLIEPLSGNPFHYRYIEFRRVSQDVEQ